MHYQVERQIEDGSWIKVGLRDRHGGVYPATFRTLKDAQEQYRGPQFRFVEMADFAA